MDFFHDAENVESENECLKRAAPRKEYNKEERTPSERAADLDPA
jgi:hypothetical protein